MGEELREVGIFPIIAQPPGTGKGTLPPLQCQQGAQENPRLPSAGMRGWKGIRALPRDRRKEESGRKETGKC